MTEEEVTAAARAIKAELDKFRDPVRFYIDNEAMYRWEARNPEGEWFNQPEANDDLESYRIIARAALSAKA